MLLKGVSTPVVVAVAIALGAVVGAVGLYASGAGADKTSDLASACPARSPLADIVTANATGEVRTMRATDAQSFTDMAFTGPDGTPMTLADFNGKTVLLNLWATWCAPCREEMPDLDALQETRGGETFEVIALNLDRGDDDKPQRFYEEIGLIHLAHYRDGTLGVFNRMRGEGLVLGLPATFLFDQDGCLAGQMSGPAHWASDDAFALIDAAIAADQDR